MQADEFDSLLFTYNISKYFEYTRPPPCDHVLSWALCSAAEILIHQRKSDTYGGNCNKLQ